MVNVSVQTKVPGSVSACTVSSYLFSFQNAVLRHKSALNSELARLKVKAKVSDNAGLLSAKTKAEGRWHCLPLKHTDRFSYQLHDKSICNATVAFLHMMSTYEH